MCCLSMDNKNIRSKIFSPTARKERNSYNKQENSEDTLLEADTGSLGGKAGDGKGGGGVLNDARDGGSGTLNVERSGCAEILDGGR